MAEKAAAYLPPSLKARIVTWMVTAILGGLALNIIWLNVSALRVEGSRNTNVHGAIRDQKIKALEAKHENGIEGDIKEMRDELKFIRMQLTGISTHLELQKRE